MCINQKGNKFQWKRMGNRLEIEKNTKETIEESRNITTKKRNTGQTGLKISETKKAQHIIVRQKKNQKQWAKIQ